MRQGHESRLRGTLVMVAVAIPLIMGGTAVAVVGCSPDRQAEPGRVTAANEAFSLVPPDGFRVRHPSAEGLAAGAAVLELLGPDGTAVEPANGLVVAVTVAAEPVAEATSAAAYHDAVVRRVAARMLDVQALGEGSRTAAGLTWTWQRVRYRETRDRELLGQVPGNGNGTGTATGEQPSGRLPLWEAWYATAVDGRYGYHVHAVAPPARAVELDAAVADVLASLRRP